MVLAVVVVVVYVSLFSFGPCLLLYDGIVTVRTRWRLVETSTPTMGLPMNAILFRVGFGDAWGCRCGNGGSRRWDRLGRVVFADSTTTSSSRGRDKGGGLVVRKFTLVPVRTLALLGKQKTHGRRWLLFLWVVASSIVVVLFTTGLTRAEI